MMSRSDPCRLLRAIAAVLSVITHCSCVLHSTVLDPGGKYHLSWNFSDTDVTFEVQVETLGYVGLGISPNGGMPGSDIVLIWVDDATGIANISDRHAVAEAEPVVDAVQNYQIISAFQNATHTVVKFQRALEICDEEDNVITADTIRLIWAYHSEDPDTDGHAMYHGINRGSRSIFLLNSVLALPPNSDTTTTMDLFSDKVELPAKETYYSCRSFRPPKFSRKHHLIGVEPVIQDGHEMHVHHILIYGCVNNVSESSFDVQHQCQHRNMPLDWWNCNAMFFGWAIGGGNSYLPDHVGIPFGTDEDPTLLLLEIHYDNPQLKAGMVDSSGLRLIFTPELRQYDAAIIATGTLPGPTQIIPPYEPNFLTVTHCTAGCYEEAMTAGEVDEIKVVGYLLHTHLIGRAVRVRHFREGVELNPIAEDMNYDFNLQDFRVKKTEVSIRRGDHTVTECFYNSEKRRNVTLGGQSTSEEMCIAFLLYYPKLPMSLCYSVPRPSFLAKFGGITVADNWRVLDPPELASKYLPHMLDDLVDWRNATIRRGFQELLKMREPDSYVSVCLHGSITYPSHLRFMTPPAVLIALPEDSFFKCRINGAQSIHSWTIIYLLLVLLNICL